jgi:hypothetical protein
VRDRDRVGADKFAGLKVKRGLHTHVKAIAAMRNQSVSAALHDLLTPVLEREEARLTKLRSTKKPTRT